MKVFEFHLGPNTSVGQLIEDIRTLRGGGAEVQAEVAEIVESVASGGDAALLEMVSKFDGQTLRIRDLRIDLREITTALDRVEQRLRASLELAADNVRDVAEAERQDDLEMTLPDGQIIKQRQWPLRRVGVYVPGGRAAYPTSVLMACIPAQVAKVREIVVATPPMSDGKIDPLVLAACALCGVTEVYRMGGAHAIAALAYGTDSVRPVDLIVGPGNRYVQEAKRQLVGKIGIDGIAGPSELLALVDASATVDNIALDLLAQAEHGPDSLLVLAGSDRSMLDAVSDRALRMADGSDSLSGAPLAVVQTETLQDAVAFSEELAPEHLELACRGAEEIAEGITRAGCVFVGPNAATAFGDYVAGSNHILPTDGAAAFASGLGLQTFQRRTAYVSLSDQAAERLATHVSRLALAEGFPFHGKSAEARATRTESDEHDKE